MSQNDLVLDYIKQFNCITSLEAIKELGVTRLASRIYDLKKEGHEFETEDIKVHTRSGYTTVTKYKLKEKHGQN